MGILDRDYMREDDPADWWKPGYSLKRWLTIGLIAISLLTSLLWLVRSSGFLRSHSHESHGKQSLIVNINSANLADLETLPNIGPVRAQAIIAQRPYRAVDELKKVSGISARQLEQLRPFVKVDGKTEKISAKLRSNGGQSGQNP
jgi:DNA uptake protein and related DNA-binding proteins